MKISKSTKRKNQPNGWFLSLFLHWIKAKKQVKNKVFF
mgnify:CR=1 FL=1